MNEVEFVREEMPGYTAIKYKIKLIKKRLTDWIYDTIDHLFDIKIKNKMIPIYEYGKLKYCLLVDLYKFEDIGQSTASMRIKNMRENDEFNFPTKELSKQELRASFPSSIKLMMSYGGVDLIMIRLPDVITYFSHAKSIAKYRLIKKLVMKVIQIGDNELKFLYNELELLNASLYHKVRKYGYTQKYLQSNTYCYFRRLRYRYDSLTGVELPPLQQSWIHMHHNIDWYSDDVMKHLATENIKWVKVHKKGAYKD